MAGWVERESDRGRSERKTLTIITVIIIIVVIIIGGSRWFAIKHPDSKLEVESETEETEGAGEVRGINGI